MKARGVLSRMIFAGVVAFLSCSYVYSQEQSAQLQDTTKQKVIVLKNDGSSFTGVIISKDERELLLNTDNLGRIYIPLHEIKEIRPYEVSGRGATLFSTRYFITTNGLSMEKGDKYALLSWYGPEAHFAVADNFSLGIMTTWVAMPIIGSAKYTIEAGEKTHIGIGLLAGTLSWADFSSGGALLYGSVTFGDFNNNFTLSAGYAGITSPDGSGSAPLLSPACLLRIRDKVSFLVDTFIYLGEGDDKFGIIIPGLRFMRPRQRSSIQFGFAAIAANGELSPMPVPVVSWFFEL